jgi:AcrR family transcriptional regulator
VTRTGLGLRERKKQRTRAAIQREAMRLFLKQGYEQTTIEQIAEAADISPSTFFNYFPSKDDVVISDDYDPLIVAALAARPRDEPLALAIRRTMTDILGEILERDRDVILARTRLILSEPDLRARTWEQMESAQNVIRVMIADRLGRDPEDFELRVVAGVLVGGLMAAVQEWVRNDGREAFPELIDRALDVIEAGMHAEATDT